MKLQGISKIAEITRITKDYKGLKRIRRITFGGVQKITGVFTPPSDKHLDLNLP